MSELMPTAESAITFLKADFYQFATELWNAGFSHTETDIDEIARLYNPVVTIRASGPLEPEAEVQRQLEEAWSVGDAAALTELDAEESRGRS